MADVLVDRTGLLSIDNPNGGNAVSGDNQLSLNVSTKELINKQNEFELSRVTKFTKQDEFITLFGNYPQNSVDITKFDLSSINVVNDKNVTFNFILCIKDGVNSEPQLYATSKFYELLVSAYNDNNPIPVNYLLHQRKVVVIDIEPILEKVERLRENELSLIGLRNTASANILVQREPSLNITSSIGDDVTAPYTVIVSDESDLWNGGQYSVATDGNYSFYWEQTFVITWSTTGTNCGIPQVTVEFWRKVNGDKTVLQTSTSTLGLPQLFVPLGREFTLSLTTDDVVEVGYTVTAVMGSTCNYTFNAEFLGGFFEVSAPVVDVPEVVLNEGSTGDIVKTLQQFLNSSGFILAESGPGSPGNETNFFGNLTVNAVRRWKVANGLAADIRGVSSVVGKDELIIMGLLERDIKVFRNLFVISNYEELESGRIVANSTYNIIELLKYISWVVSKPNPNYDDRLLPTNIIGEWGDERQLDIYNVDEPSLLNSISLIQPNDGGIVQL
jgi:hypothetical protein